MTEWCTSIALGLGGRLAGSTDLERTLVGASASVSAEMLLHVIQRSPDDSARLRIIHL